MKNFKLIYLLLFISGATLTASADHVNEMYKELFFDKNILVTGGTGTVGSALVHELLKYNPKTIIIYSRDEAKQFYLAQQLQFNPKIKFVLGDARNYDSVLQATRNVHIVFHTAALKRVESVESNVEEAIKTNVLGSTNVFKACITNEVNKVVYVSTDKSCSPINAYGASKFLGEKIFSNYDMKNIKTVFTAVRFGNIVGSTGSILSIFTEKIKKNEDIPLTDARMTRFIISKEEVVSSIFYAALHGKGGEIFIKKLPAIKIIDFIIVLKHILNSSSNIVTIGMRPGERLYESLLTDAEVARTYEYNNYYIVTPSISEWISSFSSDNLPIYIQNGIALSSILTKEPNSNDYLITQEELASLFTESFMSLIN